MARTDILERKDEIKKWISENKSKAFISQELGCKQETLNKYLKLMNIEYTGNQAGRGIAKPREKMSFNEYLSNSINLQTSKLKRKLLDEGIKPHKCERCGLIEWLGQPIPLELHYKDGNRNNNELSNYELLCPNCHAFTDSYRGRNCQKK